MDKIFELEIGSWTNLKGHAVVYWASKQEEQSVILAVNFCISAFPFDGNLIATTFPLSYFYSREEFMFYIQRSSVDLIFLGEMDFVHKEDYLLNTVQHKQLNKAIEYYLTVFKTKIADKMSNLSPIGKIELTKTWLNHLQLRDRKANKSFDISSIKSQIKSLLLELESTVIPYKDIQSFISFLDSKNRNRYKIMSLYLQEFLAILEEEYEQVIEIRSQIQKLSKPKTA